jgi:hypothetical protein
VRKVIDGGHRLRRELASIGLDSADGDSAEPDTVIAACSANEANALWLAFACQYASAIFSAVSTASDLSCRRHDRCRRAAFERLLRELEASGCPIWNGGA